MSSEWYITSARVAVNWGTAVVSNVATIDIYRLYVDSGHEQIQLWRKAGQPAAAADVAAAQAATAVGSVPARILPPSPFAPGGSASTGGGIPAGGTTGQVLAKTSATDYATGWATPSAGGAATYFREDTFTTVSGTNRSFTLAATPLAYGLQVFKNGALLQNGVGYAWTSGTTAVTGVTASTGDVVTIRYTTATSSPGATALNVSTTGRPDTISGLAGWWQATDLTAADGATVDGTTWLDKVSGRAFAASSSTAMATGVSGVAGGKAIRNGLLLLPPALWSGATAVTAMGVWKSAQTTGQMNSGPWRIGGNDNSYYTYFDNCVYDGFFTNTRFTSSSIAAAHPGAAWRKYGVRHKGQGLAWDQYQDGTVIKNNAATTFSAPGSGQLMNGSDGTWNGWMAEFVFYTRALTDQEMTDLTAWLTTRHS